MPTPRKAGRFGGSPAHHKHIIGNLATELIRHGRVRTTHTKAKTVQPTAERLITFAKRGDLASRRRAGRIVRDGDVLHHLFAEVGPAFAARDGGYTRVLKLGPRKGDAAQMAMIELVADVGRAEDGTEADEPRRRWSLRRRQAERGAAGHQTGEAITPTAEVDEEPADEAPAEDVTEADPAEVEARLSAQEDEPEAEPSDEEEGSEPADDGEDQDRA